MARRTTMQQIGGNATRSTVKNPSGVPTAMMAPNMNLGGSGVVLGG